MMQNPVSSPEKNKEGHDILKQQSEAHENPPRGGGGSKKKTSSKNTTLRVHRLGRDQEAKKKVFRGNKKAKAVAAKVEEK